MSYGTRCISTHTCAHIHAQAALLQPNTEGMRDMMLLLMLMHVVRIPDISLPLGSALLMTGSAGFISHTRN